MKVITLGEIMLRLAPEGYYRFVQAESLGATFGGGEANVAVSLANFGCEACFVTKLPAHEIGQAAINSLRRYGVDTSFILRGGDRVGIYYLEKGASQRASKVIYDRKGSSFAASCAEEYPWQEIFKGADWFHFTGITPALGENALKVTEEACKAAKACGVTVSCDLNYRQKLWSREEASRAMSALMEYVDVCICNEDDAADVFGIRALNSDTTRGKIDKEAYISVAAQLMERFHLRCVAVTLFQGICDAHRRSRGRGRQLLRGAHLCARRGIFHAGSGRICRCGKLFETLRGGGFQPSHRRGSPQALRRGRQRAGTKMKRAVVTGATGAVGSALLRALTGRGVECLVLLRPNSARAGNLPQSPLISVLPCALEEFSLLQNRTGREYDVFYHLAWKGTTGADRQDLPLQLENVSHALDAVELAKRFGCHTFIGAGSQAEYGRVEGALKADTQNSVRGRCAANAQNSSG